MNIADPAYARGMDGIDLHRILEVVARVDELFSELGHRAVLLVAMDYWVSRERLKSLSSLQQEPPD